MKFWLTVAVLVCVLGCRNEGEQKTIESTHEAISELEKDAGYVKEIFDVVLIKKKIDKDRDLIPWLNVLSQGGSLEGIYNGITHSDMYRTLELRTKAASPPGLKVFSTQFMELIRQEPLPRKFDLNISKPLKRASLEEVDEFTAHESVVFKSSEEIEKFFVGASFYTLKRVIGDELLDVLDLKSKDEPLFHQWYGNWAAQMAQQGVDFGLRERNLSDPEFHSKWAMNNRLDRIKWEALNKIHRLLNAANGGSYENF